MVRFPEAETRLFKKKFVCRKCKTVMRVPPRKVAEGAVTCRKCGSHAFKAKRKK